MVWALSLLTMDIITHRLTPVFVIHGIRSLVGFGIPVRDPRPSSSSTSVMNPTRLYLNIFRGEPAISQFDKPFTPIHRSSETFSTVTSSDLQPGLTSLHPAHG